MLSATHPARIEQQQSLTQPLHLAFANLAFSYGMTIKETERGELTGSAVVGLQCDCEELLALSVSLRGQLRKVQL